MRASDSASCVDYPRLARVALYVRLELGLVAVGPAAHELELAVRVVEGGRRELGRGVEGRRDLELGVDVARIGQREVGEEVRRRLAAVVGVDPDERDLVAMLRGQRLEPRELGAA